MVHMKPVVGMEFEHPHDRGRLYRVTRVLRRLIYFRPVDGGSERIGSLRFWAKIRGRNP